MVCSRPPAVSCAQNASPLAVSSNALFDRAVLRSRVKSVRRGTSVLGAEAAPHRRVAMR